ncbi:zinc c3hc4 type domain containing [Lasius niger]|uniref:Zinc c3hc4 type domain containing n=1 Tax=Lasius niger TaxID=67767 RepID=A0A0J7MMP3_LASNI|nr:zinc c3hc4 type domain containing [Lasius niger]
MKEYPTCSKSLTVAADQTMTIRCGHQIDPTCLRGETGKIISCPRCEAPILSEGAETDNFWRAMTLLEEFLDVIIRKRPTDAELTTDLDPEIAEAATAVRDTVGVLTETARDIYTSILDKGFEDAKAANRL